LYYADLTTLNVFITTEILKCHVQYKCQNQDKDKKVLDVFKYNWNIGDTLKLNVKDKWNIDTFDAVIGNPPYQEFRSSGDNKLYLHFTKYAFKILNESGILIFITPSNIMDYLLCVSKNRNFVKELKNIVYVGWNTPRRYFKIGSTFTYFVIYNTSYKGKTRIEYLDANKMLTIDYCLKIGISLPKRLTQTDLSILSKITSTTDLFEFKNFCFNGKKQRIRKEHFEKNIVSKTQTKQHKYIIIDTRSKTHPNGKYFYYDKLDDDIESNKIIFSNKGYLMPYYDDKHDKTYSDNFTYIKVKNKSLMTLFESKIIKYLCFQYSKNGFDKIQSIRFLKSFKNEIQNIHDIYKIYNLTQKEIEWIEKH
jgi:hypothetical protein